MTLYYYGAFQSESVVTVYIRARLPVSRKTATIHLPAECWLTELLSLYRLGMLDNVEHLDCWPYLCSDNRAGWFCYMNQVEM